MDLPKELIVGPLTYKVETVDGDLIDSGVYGQTNFRTQVIEIDSSLSEDMKLVTLFHEVLHVIESQHRSPTDKKQFTEEEVVWLSNGLYLFLKENGFGDVIECHVDLDMDENGHNMGQVNGDGSTNNY
tara:strand:- start:604 stop:987 length:384 start_codon:yes stop_codon:yes gene_type:complete